MTIVVSINCKLSQMFVLRASCAVIITSVLNFLVNFLLQVLCNLLFLFLFCLTQIGSPSQITSLLIRFRQIFPHIMEWYFWTCLNLLNSVVSRTHTPFDEVFSSSFCLLFCLLSSFLGLFCFCLALLFCHQLLLLTRWTVYCRFFGRFIVFLCFFS